MSVSVIERVREKERGREIVFVRVCQRERQTEEHEREGSLHGE